MLNIVIPTFNRLDSLKRTLASLAPLNKDELVSICVIDNASNDGTWKWLEASREQLCINISRNPYNLGIEGNLVRALTYPQSGYVWLLSDHMIVDSDAVIHFMDRLRSGLNFSIAYARIDQYEAVLGKTYCEFNLSDLTGEEKSRLVFYMSNISAFVASVDSIKSNIRSIVRFSGFSYPHLGIFTGLKETDKVVELPCLSSFDTSPSQKRTVSYDGFRSRFIGFAKARQDIARLNSTFSCISRVNKPIRQLSSALAWEVLKSICFRNEHSPRTADYWYCFVTYHGKIRFLLLLSALLSLLPIKPSVFIARLIVRVVSPVRYRKLLNESQLRDHNQVFLE